MFGENSIYGKKVLNKDSKGRIFLPSFTGASDKDQLLLVENNENTTKVLDELLVAHAKYLPQFKEKIEELKAKGVHSTDPVVMDLMENGH